MLISELIKYLEEQKNIHGDIPVCHSESHEYWGSVQTHLNIFLIKTLVFI